MNTTTLVNALLGRGIITSTTESTNEIHLHSFRECLILLREGANENLALSILKCDEEALTIITTLSSEPKYLPGIAYFYNTTKDKTLLKDYFRKLKSLVDRKIVVYSSLGNKGVKVNDDTITDFLHFTEVIDRFYNTRITIKGKNDATPIDAKSIFSIPNNIDIYLANSIQACIKYGQGYPFCISRPGKDNLYQSYRDNNTSTFYFVLDRTRDKSDPLHIVVVDATPGGFLLTDASNNTGHISKYGYKYKDYLEYLYNDRGVPRNLFKNIPKSKEEVEEQAKLGNRSKDLTWFRNLTYDEKSKYIGRNHLLTNDQFNLLFDANANELLHQYSSTGLRLTTYQRKKIYLSKLKVSYLRSRLIANEQLNNLAKDEFDNLSLEQQNKIKDDMIRSGEKDEANNGKALSLAAGLGLENEVRLLTDKEGFKKDKDFKLSRAIVSATKSNQINIVKFLLEKLNSPNSKYIHLARIYAIRLGYLDIFKLLCNNFTLVNLSSYLPEAVKNSRISIIEFIMADGYTSNDVLLTAATYGKLNIVKLMMKKYAAFNFVEALHLAEQYGHVDVANYLRKYVDPEDHGNYA